MSKAITVQSLKRDFAVERSPGRDALGALFWALGPALAQDEPGVVEPFVQWARLFGRSIERRGGSGDGGSEPLRRLAGRAGVEVDGWGSGDAERFLFALHSYLALLLKVVAWQVLSSHHRLAAALEGDALKNALEELESGRLFQARGVTNLLQGDLFSWYLRAWDGPVEAAVRGVLDGVARYDPARLEAVSGQGRDLFKGLYQSLLPRAVRHRLGEYYTPGWLVQRLLQQLDPEYFPAGPACSVGEKMLQRLLCTRWLDPACGSGAFLVLIVGRMREMGAELGIHESELLGAILRNIAGIELNPLAALAARVNLLVQLSDLLAGREMIEIPVYQGDSLQISASSCPQGGFDPLSLGQFDRVAGNPPWIGWEHLPAPYRDELKPLWVRYGLFPHHGMDTVLGKGKKDLSMLMTCVVADRLLKAGGRLGFVITQSVFKSSGAGQGFRRFQIPQEGGPPVPLRVLAVHDMVELNPFEGASNRAAVVILEKGSAPAKRVPYTVWRKVTPGPVDSDGDLCEVMAATERLPFAAEPVDEADPTSPWLTATPPLLNALRKLLGRSDYQARAGVYSGGLNGVYWLEELCRRGDGLVVVRNRPEKGRVPLPLVTEILEPGLLYPLLLARDVGRWAAAPSALLLMVQDPQARRGMDERRMQSYYPRSYTYLKRFEVELRNRPAFKRYFVRSSRWGARVEMGPFYSMFDVGEYSLAPWKVVWPSIARELRCAVVSSIEGKAIIPQHIVTMVGLRERTEAHYLCALANSSPASFALASCCQCGGKSFGTPQVLERLRIPRFEPGRPVHRELAILSEMAHDLAARGDSRAVGGIETEVDRQAGRLWGLAEAELAEMREGTMRLPLEPNLRLGNQLLDIERPWAS